MQKILILDDEASVCSALAVMLRNSLKFLEPVTFTEPASALDNFMKNPQDFALIITDLYMPGMMGMDFCRKIREHGSNVPIIILTGYGEASSMEEAARLNINDFIEKPIRLDTFLDIIQKAIESPTGRKIPSQLSPVIRFKQQFIKQVELLLKGETPFGYTSTGFIINIFEQHKMPEATIQSFKQAASLMAEEISYLEAKATVERLEKTRAERLKKLQEWYKAHK